MKRSNNKHKMLQLSNVVRIFVVVLLKINIVHMQVPYNPCPRNFQYLSDGYRNYGRITLENIPLDQVQLEVHFAQNRRLNNYYGALTLANDLGNTFDILKSTHKISYNVVFPDDSIYPRLTLIRVNGQIICSNNVDDPFASKYQVTHSFTPTITTFNTFEKPVTMLVRPQASENRFEKYAFGDGSNQHFTITYHTITRTPNQKNQIYPTAPQAQPQLPFYTKIQTEFPSQPQLQPSPQSQLQPSPQSQVRPRPQLQSQTKRQQLLGTETSFSATTSTQQCGSQSDGDIVPFVFGSDLKIGKFPWLSAVYIRKPSVQFVCGGSLVTPRTVISAAHCFVTKGGQKTLNLNVFVTIGRHDLSSIKEDDNDVRNIDNILLHPDYSEKYFTDADIALLHLNEPAIFSRKLKPVCLWTDSSDYGMINEKEAFVAGWGGHQGGDFSDTPKEAKTMIVDRRMCREESPDIKSYITSNTICAINPKGEGPCRGDSGSGLLVLHRGFWHLRGIVSGGPLKQNECDAYAYSIYTDVATHKKWILRNMV